MTDDARTHGSAGSDESGSDPPERDRAADEQGDETMAPAGAPSTRPQDSEPSPRITFRGNRHRRRFYLPWPVLALLGGLVGWVAGGWPGAVFGFIVGFLAWKLR